MPFSYNGNMKPAKPGADTAAYAGANAEANAGANARVFTRGMNRGAILSTLVLLALLSGWLIASRSSSAASLPRAWGSKPLLSQMVLNPDSAAGLQEAIQLDQSQFETLVKLATQEEEQLLKLEAETEPILTDANLTRDEKIARIQSIEYNERLLSIIKDHQGSLRRRLSSDTYRQLVSWIEEQWREDGSASLRAIFDPALLDSLPYQKKYPRSFEVWATRYDSGGRYVVALPDKCLKFANAGAMRCNDGYQYNQNYSVAISYKGKIVVAPVLESGPWNIDDNYWSTLSDPQPRRMFADLPLGVPAAQAAYYNGYNGGLDQFGRLVKSPVAIDISWVVSEDLDLPPGNTKVTVSFLWTEGWSLPGGKKAEGPAANTEAGDEPVPAPAISWSTSTPNPDGSLIHVVQPGQTLVGIASVYAVPLEEILNLNGFSLETIIQPGDLVQVKASQVTATLPPATETQPVQDAFIKPTTTQTNFLTTRTPPSTTSPATLTPTTVGTDPPKPSAGLQLEALDYALIGFILAALAAVVTILSRARRVK